MTNDETNEMLAQSGFDIAHNMLQSAMEEVEKPEQIGNQIFVLRHVAVSILAHEAFNLESQHGISFEKYMSEVVSKVLVFKNQIREGYLAEHAQ